MLELIAREGGGTEAIEREIVRTGWESVANGNRYATLVATALEGWTNPFGLGKRAVFEVLADNDQLKNAAGKFITLKSSTPGSGNWVRLTDGTGQNNQTFGIERLIPTVDGATYALDFDYAADLGLTETAGRIAIYLDDQLIATHSGTSPLTALNWQQVGASFTGNGQTRKLRIQLDGETVADRGRSAMIDNVRIKETILGSNPGADPGNVYGVAGTPVALPGIEAHLTDTDGSERLTLELTALPPPGTTLTDGTRSVTLQSGVPVDLQGWDLAALTLTPPASFTGKIVLTVRATAHERANGAAADATREILVQVVSGTGAGTSGANPYVTPIVFEPPATPAPIIVGPLVSEHGAIQLSFAALPPMRTEEESLAADRERAGTLSEAWLQELEQTAKTQWEQWMR